jgi:hypothetical protein
VSPYSTTSTHWLRHITLTWVERNCGYATARGFAGHTDAPSTGKTATYVKATLSEIAQALLSLTGEPHPSPVPDLPARSARPERVGAHQ